MVSVAVRLFGAPSIRVGGTVHEPPAGRLAALLYYLAYRGEWVSRDELLYLFWPDVTEDRARATLRTLVYAARRSGLAPGLEVERSRLRWRVATDVEPPAGGEAPTATPLLDGFRLAGAPEFDEWLELERAQLTERRRAHTLERAHAAFEASDAAGAIGTLDRWLESAPLDEEVLHRLLEVATGTGLERVARERYRAFEARLVRELELEPSARLRAAFEAMERALRGAEDVARVGAERPAPVAVSQGAQGQRGSAPFVGRRAELERLARCLATTELGAIVQIVGAGGMGKTRLGTEALEALRSESDDDHVLASFATAATAEEGLALLATAAGSDLGAGVEPLERAVAALRGRRALVLLDNVEGVAGLAPALELVRARVPEVRWLLTSRERLHLGGAEMLELDGLPLDDASEGADESTAAALFIDRVMRSGGAMTSGSDASAAEGLVRTLGGMPLAIELAAPWVRVLGVAGVRAAIDAKGDLPPFAGAPHEERHATIARVFAASWQRLDAPARHALARLTVFVDGCTLHAADEVASVRLPTVAALHDVSMLRVTREGRIVQHPLVERFVREHVTVERVDLGDVRARHAEYYLQLLHEQEDAGQAGSERAIETLQAEHGNIEAAWAWAVEHERWEPLMYGGATLGLSYVYAGRQERWGPLLRSALARIPADDLAWAVLTAHESSLDQFAQRSDDAYRRRSQALAVARMHDAPFWCAWVAFLFSQSARALGRGEEAYAALLEADAWLASIDELHVRGMVASALFATADTLEERDRRYRIHEEVRLRSGAREHEISAQVLRGNDLAQSHGRYDEALRLVESAVTLARGARWVALDLPGLLCALASLRIAVGDLERALALANEALEIGRPYAGARSYVDHAYAVYLAARAHLLLGDFGGVRTVLEGPDAALEPPSPGVAGLEARMALQRGDAAAARRHTDVLMTAVAAFPATRGARHDRITVGVLDAEVAFALGDTEAAAERVAEALALAIEGRFLPAALAALAVGAPLLPDDLARAVLATVARHSATHHEVRRTPAVERYRRGAVDLSGWEPVLPLAERVLRSLETRGPKSAGPAGQVP